MSGIRPKLIQGKKVLVTGGAGFIGSHLCADLLQMDNEVICLDNLSTGKIANLTQLMNNPRFRFIEGDIRDRQVCAEATQDVDLLLHQAALGSVPRSIADPVSTSDVNIGGFLNMLIAARDSGVRRIIFASSSSVYGDSTTLPKIEGTEGKPISPYAVTKKADEDFARVFALHYGMEIIGLRYFNVFGPRQDPDGPYAAAIPRFIRALRDGNPIVVFGDGTSSRDFTFIRNVIQMNHLAAICPAHGLSGEMFNTATGRQTSLNALIELLREIVSSIDPRAGNCRIEYAPQRRGDIQHSHASIEKAARLLGYQPEYSLQDGLMECVKWYWDNLP
jgi:UDP-N-acetylglucosamine 4-epimerase